jgi:hypothetical protein
LTEGVEGESHKDLARAKRHARQVKEKRKKV